SSNDRSALLIAIGDDRTDEDMFRALPDRSFTVKVSGGPTRARFGLESVDAVRRFLQLLADALAGPASRG
ncbi:MAG: hypothetical protein ACE5EF_13695, partial [Dehalococcoidia bacterium]